MTIDKKCVVEFKGRRIDPDKISNPKLAKVFRERVHDGEQFLFNYGDSEHTDRKYDDVHSEHSEYGDNVDRTHSDRTYWTPKHTDETWYDDKYYGRDEHSDHHDNHKDQTY